MPKTAEEIATEQAAADRAAADKAAQEATNGFPADTALDQMSVEQREAYWKFQARKHENTVKSRADYDQLKQAAAELAQLKAANATAEEKALENARLQGENIGAQRYVKAAVRGEIRASAPHLKPEQVDELLSIIDTSAVLRDDGEVDAEKVGKIISSFAPADKQEKHTDSYSDTIRQSRQASGAGSIAELKKQYHEQHSKKG